MFNLRTNVKYSETKLSEIDNPLRDCSIKKCGAYLIKHIFTNKIYIGSSGDLRERIWRQRRHLTLGINRNKNLQDVYNINNKLEIYLFITETRDDAFSLEQDFIDYFKNSDLLLNVAMNARVSMRERVITEETRNKISKAHTGKKLTLDHIEKIRQSNLGQKRSEETIEILRRNSKERHKDPSYTENQRQKMIGKVHTEETKNKMSSSQKLRIMSEDQRNRLVLSNKSRSFKLKIFGKIYNSLGEASADLKNCTTTLMKRAKSTLPEYVDYQLL